MIKFFLKYILLITSLTIFTTIKGICAGKYTNLMSYVAIMKMAMLVIAIPLFHIIDQQKLLKYYIILNNFIQ